MKVAQLAGSVAEMSAYHHGEVSIKDSKVVRIFSLYKISGECLLYWNWKPIDYKSTNHRFTFEEDEPNSM